MSSLIRWRRGSRSTPNDVLLCPHCQGLSSGRPERHPAEPAGRTPASFGPDTSTNYELGFKAETANRRASLDAAVYHIDWNDIQLLSRSTISVNINGGKATVDGAELTGTVRPLAGLNVSANAAYTNASSLRFAGRSRSRERARRHSLPYTPDFSFAVNVDYDWALGAGAEAFAGFYRWLSAQTASYTCGIRCGPWPSAAGPCLRCVRPSWGLRFRTFSVEAYAKNIFDADGGTSTIGPTANGPRSIRTERSARVSSGRG